MDTMLHAEWFDFSEAWKAPERHVALVATLSHGKVASEIPEEEAERVTRKLITLGHESVFEFVRYPSPYDNARKAGLLAPERFDDSVTEKLFETVGTVRLTVPIYVARQIMRHRSFSYLELSRRYTKPPKVDVAFALPMGRSECSDTYWEAYRQVKDTYVRLLAECKEPAEFARAVLPLGTETIFWMQGDYKAWGNFFVYRLHPAAQKETRQISKKIWGLFTTNQLPLAKRTARYVLEEWVEEAPEIFRHGRERHLKEVREIFEVIAH